MYGLGIQNVSVTLQKTLKTKGYPKRKLFKVFKVFKQQRKKTNSIVEKNAKIVVVKNIEY